MSDYEIKSRFGPVEAIKWRLMRGEIITVPWPDSEEVTVDHNSSYWYDLGGAVNVLVQTDDPNYHYRPTLEQHVGRQGRDWMWRHQQTRKLAAPDLYYQYDKLEIKIHKKKARWATILLMLWGQK